MIFLHCICSEILLLFSIHTKFNLILLLLQLLLWTIKLWWWNSL
jgi:hypothetical protein